MRFFKRHVNPIFVEEEQYNWQEKRSGGKRLLLIVIVFGIAAISVAAYMT